jgi:protease-4
MADPVPNSQAPVVIPAPPPPPRRRWLTRFLIVLLLASLFLNLSLSVAFRDYVSGAQPPYERFHSGELTASNKIARLEIRGAIMPPYTERWLKSLEAIRKDDNVRGILVVVDSPGGLVADSHQIYSALRKLRDTKPAVVSMKRLAASGGYYVSMGAGPNARIFAEPTTWTGSIGVILPRYNLSELANHWGVKSEPLVTGPLKNTLDPLQDMKPEEREVWMKVLEDAFERFIEVIDDGRRDLDPPRIRELATGQVYTANQALAAGLVDAIGDEEAALDSLKQQLGLTDVRVIKYEFPTSLVDLVIGSATADTQAASDPLARLFEANVPRGFYLFGWHPGLKQPSF